MKKQKQKNYKLRSKVYGGAGNSIFALTTLGSFVGYEIATDWSNFKTDLDNFMVMQPETMKLNFYIAFPALIALLVYVIIWRKRNKKQLEESGNVTFGILIALLISIAIYSIIEITMITLAGAFVGSITDSTIFKPLAKGAKNKAYIDQDIELETEKEKRRILARKKAREEDLSGTV